MPAFEPGKIRNVAVVGHRGTGKTSLVEAMLFQSGELNRLGTIDAGSTVSDWDDDEQSRRMSISLALTHADWQGRKLNLIDIPGDPGFQGEARAALRVVEGALVVVSGVMGVEVGTGRVWKRAEELGLARLVFVNMLDRERADFFRALGQLQEQLSERCVAVHLPIGSEHELTGIVDVLHMTAYTSPDGGREGEPGPIPDDMAELVAGVPREAARRGRADGRGADGEVPRGRGARRRGRGARAQGRRHARRGLPGRLRGRDEEPRHARAARPDRRGRALAGQDGLDHPHRGRADGRVRLQDDRRPVRRPHQPLPRAAGVGHARPDARRRAHAREGAHGLAPLPAGQGAHPGRGVRAGRHRRRREAEGGADRRPAARPRGRDRRARDRLSRAGDELRRHAAHQGRGGEGRVGDPPARRGGSDAAPAPRPADRRGDPRRDEPDARRGRARAGEAPLRRRRRAASAARAVPRDDPQGVARARALQEADRRPRPVRRLHDRARAARRPRRLRVRRQDRRRRHPAGLPARPSTRACRRRWSTASSRARPCRACA